MSESSQQDALWQKLRGESGPTVKRPMISRRYVPKSPSHMPKGLHCQTELWQKMRASPLRPPTSERYERSPDSRSPIKEISVEEVGAPPASNRAQQRLKKILKSRMLSSSEAMLNRPLSQKEAKLRTITKRPRNLLRAGKSPEKDELRRNLSRVCEKLDFLHGFVRGMRSSSAGDLNSLNSRASKKVEIQVVPRVTQDIVSARLTARLNEIERKFRNASKSPGNLERLFDLEDGQEFSKEEEELIGEKEQQQVAGERGLVDVADAALRLAEVSAEVALGRFPRPQLSGVMSENIIIGEPEICSALKATSLDPDPTTKPPLQLRYSRPRAQTDGALDAFKQTLYLAREGEAGVLDAQLASSCRRIRHLERARSHSREGVKVGLQPGLFAGRGVVTEKDADEVARAFLFRKGRLGSAGSFFSANLMEDVQEMEHSKIPEANDVERKLKEESFIEKPLEETLPLEAAAPTETREPVGAMVGLESLFPASLDSALLVRNPTVKIEYNGVSFNFPEELAAAFSEQEDDELAAVQLFRLRDAESLREPVFECPLVLQDLAGETGVAALILRLAPKLWEAAFIAPYSEQGEANAPPPGRRMRVPLRLDVPPENIEPDEDDQRTSRSPSPSKRAAKLRRQLHLREVELDIDGDRSSGDLRAAVARFKTEKKTERVLVMKVGKTLPDWMTLDEARIFFSGEEKTECGPTQAPGAAEAKATEETQNRKRSRSPKKKNNFSPRKIFSEQRAISAFLGNVVLLPSSPPDRVCVFESRTAEGEIFFLSAPGRDAAEKKVATQLESKLLDQWKSWAVRGRHSTGDSSGSEWAPAEEECLLTF